MITETLLRVAVGLVSWFASIVPDFGLDLGSLDVGAFWADLGARVAALNGWVPVLAAGGVAVAFLIVQVAMSVWGLVVWVYHQFWGSD